VCERDEAKARESVEKRDVYVCIFGGFVVVMPSGLCERHCVRERKQRREYVWKREMCACAHMIFFVVTPVGV